MSDHLWCALEGCIAGNLLFTVHEDRDWPVTLIMGRWQIWKKIFSDC